MSSNKELYDIYEKIPNAKTIKSNFEKIFKKKVSNCKKNIDGEDKRISIFGWLGYKFIELDE